MNNKVLLSINGLHAVSDAADNSDGDDTVEVITVGEYYFRNDKHYVVYEEVDEGDNKSTKSVIKFNNDFIEVKKTGDLSTNMKFEVGKINKSYYSTPFGDMMVEINTSNIDLNIQDELIDINVDYSLSINSQHMTDCKVGMTIRQID